MQKATLVILKNSSLRIDKKENIKISDALIYIKSIRKEWINSKLLPLKNSQNRKKSL